MTVFLEAFRAEGLKVFRSKVPLVCFLAFCLGPIMGALVMVVLSNPAMVKNTALSAKAEMMGAMVDWPSYFAILGQVMGVGGFIVFGFVATWIFGREYVDKTAKDLLALPISRTLLMIAKFFVLFVLCSFMAGGIFILGFLLAGLLALPGLTQEAFVSKGLLYLGSFLLTLALLPSVAYAASSGRSYLPALGFVILATVFAQILGAFGLGIFFPWAVPALFTGMGGDQTPNFLSYTLVGLASVSGIIATLIWWERADHR